MLLVAFLLIEFLYRVSDGQARPWARWLLQRVQYGLQQPEPVLRRDFEQPALEEMQQLLEYILEIAAVAVLEGLEFVVVAHEHFLVEKLIEIYCLLRLAQVGLAELHTALADNGKRLLNREDVLSEFMQNPLFGAVEAQRLEVEEQQRATPFHPRLLIETHYSPH